MPESITKAIGDANKTFITGAPVDPTENSLNGTFKFGKRLDGTNKGLGFFGILDRPDGGISSELSFSFATDNGEILAPLIVPTLTKQELSSLLNGDKPTEAIVNKAMRFAIERLKAGKNTFRQLHEKSLKRPGE